jgi:hypothetical protein
VAERLTTLAFSLLFTKLEFLSLVQSNPAKISIDHQGGFATLRLQADETYPTDTDLYLISELVEVPALRGFAGFETFVAHKSIDGIQVTSDGFRLHDGTNQKWWSGTAWVTDATHWNTEQEVADAIQFFPTLSRKFRVVWHARTTNKEVSPELYEIRVAVRARVGSFMEDILLRSLVPALRTGVRPTTDLICAGFEGGTALDFASVLTDSQRNYKVMDLEAVFNESTDRSHSTNLLVSYDPDAKEAVLSPSVPPGATLFISAVYQPEVVLWGASVDYVEPSKVPALIITSSESPESSQHPPIDALSIRNKGAKRSLVIPSPYRLTIECAMIGLTPGVKDEARLAEAVIAFFQKNPVLRSAATGYEYRLQLLKEFEDMSTGQETNQLRSFQTSFKIHDVLVFAREAYTTFLVTNLNVSLLPG